MSGLGFGFSMLDSHKKQFLVHGNPFSVTCQIVTRDGEVQGSLESDDNELRGLPSEIGITVSAETGLGVISDTIEFVLDMNDVEIGVPEKGWKLIYPNRKGDLITFMIEEVIPDVTMALYRLQLGVTSGSNRTNRVGRNKPIGSLNNA